MSKDNIIDLRKAPTINGEVVAMLEGLLARARKGVVVGLAVVEHQHGDAVRIEVSATENYHHINSGAARLAHFLAGLQH